MRACKACGAAIVQHTKILGIYKIHQAKSRRVGILGALTSPQIVVTVQVSKDDDWVRKGRKESLKLIDEEGSGIRNIGGDQDKILDFNTDKGTFLGSGKGNG